MKNSIIIAAFVWTSISFFACKPKENPLDNSNTIKVPYAMFMGTRHGDVLKTNDTKTFARGDAAFADFSISIGVGYKF